jgi:CMD domain protein
MSTSTATVPDVLNAILGVNDDDPIVAIRNQKPALVTELQDYYLALFEPTADSAAALPIPTRLLVAVRVASHTGSEAVASWYRAVGREAGVPDAEFDRVADVYAPADGNNAVSAAIRHTDLLTLRPADATPADLQALKDAGYAPAGIVSLSQTIAFVSYQLRLAAALRALGGAR